MQLCNDTLPWVGSGKHLGMKIENVRDIFKKDIKEKRARYIQGNNQLMQEFSFASTRTKVFINRVYNGHHYGAVLWDLYGKETEMVFNTWNTSIRRMLRIDRRTHRCLIEPLSGTQHVKRAIFKAFISFVNKLQYSPKEVVRDVFQLIKGDCRSITGSNIRNINLDCAVDQVHPFAEVDIEKKDFFPAPADSAWRVSLIQELINIRDGDSNATGWTKEEVKDALEYLCTQ